MNLSTHEPIRLWLHIVRGQRLSTLQRKWDRVGFDHLERAVGATLQALSDGFVAWVQSESSCINDLAKIARLKRSCKSKGLAYPCNSAPGAANKPEEGRGLASGPTVSGLGKEPWE